MITRRVRRVSSNPDRVSRINQLRRNINIRGSRSRTIARGQSQLATENVARTMRGFQKGALKLQKVRTFKRRAGLALMGAAGIGLSSIVYKGLRKKTEF